MFSNNMWDMNCIDMGNSNSLLSSNEACAEANREQMIVLLSFVDEDDFINNAFSSCSWARYIYFDENMLFFLIIVSIINIQSVCGQVYVSTSNVHDK